MPRSSIRMSLTHRRYANHIALATSICEPSNCFEEVRCDALMEENDVWVTFPFQQPIIESKTTANSYLQMACLVEMQWEKTSVCESTFLVLAFQVTPKAFTPCLGVLHVMWSAWCVDYPWLYFSRYWR